MNKKNPEVKQKPIAPIFKYQVDLGKATPKVVEANRVDLVGGALFFTIEYSDFNLHVAGFSSWKSFELYKEEPLEKPPVKKEKKPNGKLF